jgi:hypothetical protein
MRPWIAALIVTSVQVRSVEDLGHCGDVFLRALPAKVAIHGEAAG